MDPELIKTFQEKVTRLQNAVSKGYNQNSTLICDDFHEGCMLTYLDENSDLKVKRFHTIKSIVGLTYPLLFACKSKAFWQAAGTKAVSEINSDFVNVRKKTNSRSKTSSSSANQSSSCGSPLELDMIADLSIFDNDTMLPFSKQLTDDIGIPHAVAVKLVSLFSNIFSQSINDGIVESVKISETPTLVVICDGDNLNGVSTLSIKPLIDKQDNFLGVKITETTSKPSANKNVHAKLCPNFSTSDIVLKAKYDILAEAGDRSHSDLQSSLKLEVEWQKVTGLSLVLLHDPPVEAKCQLKLRVFSGNTRSPAFSIYQELRKLRAVVDGLATAEVNWIGTQEHSMVDTVKGLVEQLKCGSDVVRYRFGDADQECYNVGLDTDLLEERKDLDFTDHLWKVLQNCTSYSDLIEAFNYIISELRKGDFQPFIHNYNTSAIANAVKDSFRGQLRSLPLSGLSPLQYLAEMGIQKLTQDYIHFFLSKNLASLGSLDFYLKRNQKFTEMLGRLEKLQNITETFCLLKQCLSLSQNTLIEICWQMLRHYEVSEIDTARHFEFCVPTGGVLKVMQSFQPIEWSAEGVKMVEGILQKLAYYFTNEQPFDWIKKAPVLNGKAGGGDMEEPSYFLTIVKDSVSILC